MGIFGWSYPAGCDGTPYDEDQPCEVCGRLVDDCTCPECPECGTQGDPKCQTDRGLHVVVTEPPPGEDWAVPSSPFEEELPSPEPNPHGARP